ncbi:MAG: metallophosphoesterase [Polyangiaceae bacterium]|nr:metallophosphoesterase [Polyangiaceae bacterium]
MMRSWRRLASGVAVGVLGVLLWAFVIEPSRLVACQDSIQVEGLPPMSVVLLSDIHAGCHFVDEEKIRKVVRWSNRQEPDLVVLLGDYVTEDRLGSPIPPEQTARWLGELRASSGVFAVLGNHDWWHDGERVRHAFEDAGIPVWEGESRLVEIRGQRVRILGVPDYASRYRYIPAALAQTPEDAPVLALTHSPDSFPRMPNRVRLLLAGHTHGGQVKLPVVGPLGVPSMYGARYLRGHVVERGRHLYVTSGLGMSVLPVRLGVPPEMVLLRVNL